MLTRQLELLRDQLGIRRIFLVVGHLSEQIRDRYGDGAALGLELHYIDNPDVDRGLGTALLVAEPHIDEPFVMLLGDELYLESNHAELRSFDRPFVGVCGIARTDDPEVIRRNYAIETDGDRITQLIEKPQDPDGPLFGCGTYIFTPQIFQYARQTPPSKRTGRLELTDIIDCAARESGLVFGFELTGRYMNVNTVMDLNLANFMCRTIHFENNRISLVIPAYNEADAISHVIRDFQGAVDEIIVADNQSSDGTADIARELGATVHSKPLRGYGHALREGMDAASGEILVLVEADATFRVNDLGKLLEYLKDADMVIGTRTTRQMIEQGANMDGLLRWGNVAVGKLIELLWWNVEPRFTDVGCTYRAIWRDAYMRIRSYLQRDDAAFAPEMMIEMLRAQGRVIEIPVSYYRRRGGVSKHSSSLWHSVLTGLKMLKLIFVKRLNLR
jgi:dTDP-glucose pyrophosphorylase